MDEQILQHYRNWLQQYQNEDRQEEPIENEIQNIPEPEVEAQNQNSPPQEVQVQNENTNKFHLF